MVAQPELFSGLVLGLSSSFQYLRQFLTREHDGIGFHAASVGGFLDQFGRIIGVQAIHPEAWNPQVGNQRGYPRGCIVSTGGMTDGYAQL